MAVSFLSTGAALTVGCANAQRRASRPAPGLEGADGHSVAFSGEVSRGKQYEHGITGPFAFRLVPTSHGWSVWIGDPDWPSENYSFVVTPPYRGINARFIEGWHFRNSDNSGPNSTGAKNVNAPQTVRDFCFVLDREGYRIAWAELGVLLWGVHDEERKAAARRSLEGLSKGTGRLTVRELRLGNLVVGKRAWIERIRFEAEMVVPTNSATRRQEGGAAQE